jgi:hypothetical protein
LASSRIAFSAPPSGRAVITVATEIDRRIRLIVCQQSGERRPRAVPLKSTARVKRNLRELCCKSSKPPSRSPYYNHCFDDKRLTPVSSSEISANVRSECPITCSVSMRLD